ncbi:hypothetical protein HDV63DRAFT_109476 [Trichoderma sp. SZMC 28014]
MCTTNVYDYHYSDGRREQSRQPVLCSASRNGVVCSQNVVFQHPSQYIKHTPSALGSSPGSPSPYLSQFPPTPTYSPRSGTPNYRSGDESDRSRHSSSSSSRRRRSSSLYINGQNVIDLNRHDGSPRRERIVLVEGPPTPRTPPTAFSFASYAPPSPNASANASASASVYGSSPRESNSSFSRRPVIVDDRVRVERPRIEIEVVEAAPSSQRTPRHDRHSSTSSRDSHGRSSADDEVTLQRRREREERRAEKERDEEDERQRRIRLRIAKANAEINKRPPVPMPPAPLRASSFKNSSADDSVKTLADGVRRMSFEEERREEKVRHLARKQERRDEEQAQRLEDEAQRQRLAERISMPQRRATVGGGRRHRVVYDDGTLYRVE